MTTFSKKFQYAIHALVYVAENKEPTTQVRKISEARNIPRKFLEGIFLELCKGGILGSKQGKGGGYYLKINPSAISLKEIIQLVEGGVDTLPCLSAPHYEPCGMCPDQINCRIKNAFSIVKDKTHQALADTNLSDIVGKNRPTQTTTGG